MKDWIILKCLLVKKSPNCIVCQLLHEKECFTNVQKHGKIMIFPMGAHVDALCQNHVGSFLKFWYLIPGDDKFYWKQKCKDMWDSSQYLPVLKKKCSRSTTNNFSIQIKISFEKILFSLCFPFFTLILLQYTLLEAFVWAFQTNVTQGEKRVMCNYHQCVVHPCEILSLCVKK